MTRLFHHRWVTVALAIGALASIAVPTAVAQEAGDQAENSTHVASYRSVLDIVQEGGPMMVPLFACSFVTVVFVLERMISLRRGRVIPRPFVKRFLHQVSE